MFSEACFIAARRTERFTDHATIARQASRVRPMRPRAAPTAIKTVPSGALLSCIYGAFAVGGMVTITAAVVEEEDVDDVVVVVTDDVVVLLSDVVDEDVDDVELESVVVESIVVLVLVLVDEEEDVVLDVLDVDVEVEEEVVAVVSLTLEVLCVEGSSVVWAASVSVDVSSAGMAET